MRTSRKQVLESTKREGVCNGHDCGLSPHRSFCEFLRPPVKRPVQYNEGLIVGMSASVEEPDYSPDRALAEVSLVPLGVAGRFSNTDSDSHSHKPVERLRLGH